MVAALAAIVAGEDVGARTAEAAIAEAETVEVAFVEEAVDSNLLAAAVGNTDLAVRILHSRRLAGVDEARGTAQGTRRAVGAGDRACAVVEDATASSVRVAAVLGLGLA